MSKRRIAEKEMRIASGGVLYRAPDAAQRSCGALLIRGPWLHHVNVGPGSAEQREAGRCFASPRLYRVRDTGIFWEREKRSTLQKFTGLVERAKRETGCRKGIGCAFFTIDHGEHQRDL